MYPAISEIDAHELREQLQQNPDGVRVIDVRQPQEYYAGTVPGAQLMPLASLPLRMHEIETDRPVVLICRSGARSAQACVYLGANGRNNIYNLRGGMIAWVRAGLGYAVPEAA